MAAPSTAPRDAETATGPEERACPHCGGGLAPLQEYCLECGLRVDDEPGVRVSVASAWGRRGPWYAREWVVPVLAAAVVPALATVAAVAAVRSADDAEDLAVATLPAPPPAPRKRAGSRSASIPSTKVLTPAATASSAVA